MASPAYLQRRNSDRKLAARIARSMAAVLPTVMTQMQQMNTNANPVNQSTCTFKTFQCAKPPTFDGSKGATALLQWFEGMENTFLHSECPDDKKTRFASSVFEKTALNWWSKEKNTRGTDEAMAMPWAELKEIMTQEFCPFSEMQNLEAEFWLLEQNSGDNATYTTRFHELSLLVPHLVTPLKRAINKYIRGLPMPIKDSVLSSAPKTLSDAITLAATLSDNHVKAGTLTKNGVKKTPTIESPKPDKTEPSTQPAPKTHYNNSAKKRKQNFALTNQPASPPLAYPPPAYQPQPYQTQIAQPPPFKKPYSGHHPFCPACKRHHLPGVKCRQCFYCGQVGHLSYACPTVAQANPVAPPYAPTYPTMRACYNCGDPSHFRNNCPNLVYQIHAIPTQAHHHQVYQAQTQVQAQNQAQQDQVPNNQALVIQPQPNQPNQVQENQVNQGAQGRVYHINANEFQLRNHGTATR